MEIYPHTQSNNKTVLPTETITSKRISEVTAEQPRAKHFLLYILSTILFNNSHLMFTNIHLNMFQENANQCDPIQLFHCRENNPCIQYG